MAHYRCLVNMSWTDSLPRDWASHTLHFESAGILTEAEKQDLVDDVKAAFQAYTDYGSRGYDVRLYNMADTKPRPIAAQSITTPVSAMTTLGNRDVALCLSFYADRNLPRYRGRLYLGPFGSANVGNNRPGATQRNLAITLANAFAGAGPASTKWCVYSTVDALLRPITNVYVDDEWDTQRRRGLRPTTRTTGTVSA